MNKKENFKSLIMDFLKIYPQIENGNLLYCFTGGISLNILSIAYNHQINKYKIKDNKLIYLGNFYKVKIELLKKFFREISDIDIEIYNEKVFNIVDYQNKVIDYSFDILKYKNAFNDNINDLKLDFFKPNYLSDRIFSVTIDGKEIFIDDFRYNIGYRLYTFAKLSDERFNIDNEKYDYTIHKYKRDIDCQLSILEGLYSMEEIKKFIKESMGHNYHKYRENNFYDLSQLKLNKLLFRLSLLKIKKKYELYLRKLIEELKLELYTPNIDNPILLLNNFSFVNKYEMIKKGKSSADKYIIFEKDKKKLLKIYNYSEKDRKREQYEILKLISQKVPSIQKVYDYRENENIGKCFIIYEYVEGNDLYEIKLKDYFHIGKICGKILKSIHSIQFDFNKYNYINNEWDKINYSLKNYKNIRIPEMYREKVNKYIEQNIEILKNKNLCFLHLDLGKKNIISNEENIVIIDFDNCAFGPCMLDFKKASRDYEETFFKGLFYGYFNGQDIPDYYKKLYFLCLILYNLYFYDKKNIYNKKEQKFLMNKFNSAMKLFLDYNQ